MSRIVPTRTLYGLELRYVLTMMLRDHGAAATISELVRGLDRAGFAVYGRPSKTVSDALRWEIRKGRVVRLGRGVYGPGRMPRSTEWWIRKRIEAIHMEVVARTLAEPVAS